MPTLTIDCERNSAQMVGPDNAGAVHQFSRRWAAAMLARLTIQARKGHALDADTLQHHLRHLGQAKPLTRAQLQRLVNEMQPFLTQHPWLQMRLHHAPRQASVGPWTLWMGTPITVKIVDAQVTTHTARPGWPHPQLVALPQPEQLRSVLSTLLVSDALSVDGQHSDALGVLADMDTLCPALTPEAQALVRLRQANLLRRMGRFDDVHRTLAPLLVADTGWADPAIPDRTRIYQQRARYDQHPGTAWQDLLASPHAPTASHNPDPVASQEWHNLQALSLRRKMHTCSDQPALLALCHQQALQHLGSALYYSLTVRNWDSLQAYTSNLAYHLQTAIPWGLATVQEAHDWHLLSIACAEKLDCGRDCSWEFIFFAEFWLDHVAQNAMADPRAAQSSLLLASQLHPSQENYYQRTLERVAICGDVRQTATSHIVYLRWARHYQPQRQKRIVQALADLLELHTALRQELALEGYAEWLPPTSTS